MGLIQRVISVLLYGNNASKQVGMQMVTVLTSVILQMYTCLQPLMVCLSYNGTLAQMKCLAKDFDAPVMAWSNALVHNIKVHILLFLCLLTVYICTYTHTLGRLSKTQNQRVMV